VNSLTKLPKSPLRIACIGEAMIELAVVSEGTTSALGVAGDTLNTAIYLKRALERQAQSSSTVAYITTLGTDAFSQRIIDFIDNENIDTSCIQRSNTRIPGLYAITTDEQGERSFTYWRENSAARTLFQTDTDISFDVLSDFDVIFFSGITLAILPDEVRSQFLTWLDNARRTRNVTTVFDSNYRPRLWRDHKEAQHWMTQAWQVTSLGLPSLDDEMDLFELESESLVLSRLRECGVVDGVLKRGAAGPCNLNGDSAPELTTAKVDVIDTTAAGDSFNGAYLASRLLGASEADAMQAGHQCAATVIGYAGAIIPKSLA